MNTLMNYIHLINISAHEEYQEGKSAECLYVIKEYILYPLITVFVAKEQKC